MADMTIKMELSNEDAQVVREMQQLLYEAYDAIYDFVGLIYNMDEMEMFEALKFGDTLYLGPDYDPEMEEPIPVGVQVRKAKRDLLSSIIQSWRLKNLEDVNRKIENLIGVLPIGMDKEQKVEDESEESGSEEVS